MADKRFAGKSVMVTGGASGIGKATTERLAAEGADIAIADINVDGARTVVDAIASKHGVRATAIAYNAAEAASKTASTTSGKPKAPNARQALHLEL